MSFLSSYAIPVHARRVVIIHRDDLERWRQPERGREEGEVFSLMNRYTAGTVNLTSTLVRSSFERSLLFLITPVDVIMCINNVCMSVD